MSLASSRLVLICNFFEETYFCHLRSYLLDCFYEKYLKFYISPLFPLRRFRTVEAILILSQEMMEQICDLEKVKPQAIPIKVCVIFHNIEICYRGCGEKTSYLTIIYYRTSHQRCSLKKGVLRDFAKFTGKQLCQNLFFNKVAALMPATLLKKELWHRYFPVNFAKFLKTPF